MAPAKHRWQFRARFRRRSFGWKSQPAIKRVKEAVSEITKVTRKDAILGAEGAVLFLEVVSPALEAVDSSSGSIGTAVNNAVHKLSGIIAVAAVDQACRLRWLERLDRALADDQMPYIDLLGDHWGEMCAGQEMASFWADRLLSTTRLALDTSGGNRGYFYGTTACLSSLYSAGRFDDLVTLLESEPYWHYKSWAVKALSGLGQDVKAIHVAESYRGDWSAENHIDRLCEGVLLSAGRIDEAYQCYGLNANRAGTYLAWFRKVCKKYPDKTPSQVLSDLVGITPGEEGKWFAAAKSVGLLEEATALARRSPCDPRTLTRAARDYADTNPAFAVKAGFSSLVWLVDGYGYEITNADVADALHHTLAAAEVCGISTEVKQRIAALIEPHRGPHCAAAVIRRRMESLPVQ